MYVRGVLSRRDCLSWGGVLKVPSYSADQNVPFWSQRKQAFAEKNRQYREKEALYMTFQPQVDLVCLGDSITQRFIWSDAFPDWRVANRGIGSDTTEGMLARVDSVVALSPRVVSVMAGINDLAQGNSPEQIAVSYRNLLEALEQQLPETELIVTSILPVTESHTIPNENILETNQLLKNLCAEKSILYLDIYSVFLDENGFLKDKYAFDSVHLTPEGYLLWLSYLGPALNNLELTGQ